MLTDDLLELQRELVDASAMQTSMLPTILPDTSSISWKGLFVPCAEAVGDIYNFVRLD